MSVKIRLVRFGTNKKPFYRIVVADTRAPRNGRFIEKVGTYDPKQNPPAIVVEKDKVAEWLKKGAKASPTVAQLLRQAGIGAKAAVEKAS
jgi:small subunit ribosomal protein S16